MIAPATTGLPASVTCAVNVMGVPQPCGLGGFAVSVVVVALNVGHTVACELVLLAVVLKPAIRPTPLIAYATLKVPVPRTPRSVAVVPCHRTGRFAASCAVRLKPTTRPAELMPYA